MLWTDTMIDSMDRNQLISALEISGKIVGRAENCISRIQDAEMQLSLVQQQANMIRGKITPRKLILAGVIGFVAMLIFGGFRFSRSLEAGLLVAGVYYLIDRFVLAKKREEKAEAYSQEHNPPLLAARQQAQQDLDVVRNSDDAYNCSLLLPQEYQSTAAIRVIISLLQTRRARTLAEAFSAYDEQCHRNRMEAMQMQQTIAAQDAALAQQRTAAAAEVTAMNSRDIAASQRAQARSAASIASSQRSQARSAAAMAQSQASIAASQASRARSAESIADSEASRARSARSIANSIRDWLG